MALEFLSREDTQKENSTFSPLEAEDYIAKIVEVDTNAIRQKYDSFKARGRVEVSALPSEEKENITKVVMLVYGLKSGDPIKDVNGADVPALARRAYKDVTPYGGFNKKTGMPSDYRCLFAFALQQDPTKPFTVTSPEELIGKYIGIQIEMNTKGNNTVKAFKKVPASFQPDATIEAEALQKYEEQKAKRANPQEEQSSALSAVPF